MTVATSTTLTYTNFRLNLGHRYEFRVAASASVGGTWRRELRGLGEPLEVGGELTVCNGYLASLADREQPASTRMDERK